MDGKDPFTNFYLKCALNLPSTILNCSLVQCRTSRRIENKLIRAEKKRGGGRLGIDMTDL